VHQPWRLVKDEDSRKSMLTIDYVGRNYAIYKLNQRHGLMSQPILCGL
jgi:hypothetical protein